MKKHLLKVALINICTLLVVNNTGQNVIPTSDSIVFHKPRNNRNLYTFYNGGQNEIQYSQLKEEYIYYQRNRKLREIGSNIITGLNGIGFSSPTDAGWRISGSIRCNDMLFGWKMKLFCSGYIEKDRERFHDDDGSWSDETYETSIQNWDLDAWGLIMEGPDTFGSFMIITDPREDPLVSSWFPGLLTLPDIQQNASSKIHTSVSRKPKPGDDYGIAGKFQNRDFFIIRNMTNRKEWIIMNGLLVGMFQSDLEEGGISK